MPHRKRGRGAAPSPPRPRVKRHWGPGVQTAKRCGYATPSIPLPRGAGMQNEREAKALANWS
eukprot:2424162-Pyramimonas_sp.AAC.1